MSKAQQAKMDRAWRKVDRAFANTVRARSDRRRKYWAGQVSRWLKRSQIRFNMSHEYAVGNPLCTVRIVPS